MVKTEGEYVKKNNKELETDRTLSGKDDNLGGYIIDCSKFFSRCYYKSNKSGDEFSKVRKRLPGEDDGRFSKKMAQSTPGVAQTSFSGVIDLSDEDVNYDETPEYKNISDSRNHVAFNKTQTPFSGVIDLSDEDVNYDETQEYKNVSDSRNRAAFSKTQTPHSGVTYISDEDANNDETPENKNISDSTNTAAFNKTNLEDFDKEDLDDLKFRCSNSKSAKRKRAANIIRSDDETSDNETTYHDNAQIRSSRPKIDSEDKVTEGARKRRLRRLRNLGSKNHQDRTRTRVNQKKPVVIDVNSASEDEDNDDDDDVEGFESDKESLSDFINDSPEIVSERESASESSDDFEEPEDVLNDYKETLNNIRRKKVSNSEWNLLGDMQADLGKDPLLCMRGVCALYRRQTEDEKGSKETVHKNERGFSKTDATEASDIAQFLTEGDSRGRLCKTVEQLESYDSKAIELCTSLAFKYSRQLFEIYKNKEDRYFVPL